MPEFHSAGRFDPELFERCGYTKRMATLPIHPNNRDLLKCYLYDESECFRFHISGSLGDDHAKDLEQSRLTASSVIGSRPWVLALGNVTHIGPLGRTLLHQWSQEGVKIVADSPMLSSIVRSIAAEPLRPGRRPQLSAAQAWQEYVDSTVFRLEHDLRRRRFVLHAGSEASHLVPHGLIRHYVNTMFVPGSTLAQALHFAPHFGQSECESCLVHVDDRHAYSVATENRIQSIRKLESTWDRVVTRPGSNAVSRFATITRFCEQDGGVSIEMEGIGLACCVPACLRWLADPFVRLVSRESPATTLRRIACPARP